MSMTIVAHVREKSNSRNSARTLLLDLAIYANDCCGVAWPSDTTLYHDVHVSRQRIHELKNTLEDLGELVIVERPGSTNLYFVAWQGQPLGGTSRDTGQHDPRCPLRRPHLAASGASLEGDDCLTHDVGRGSEIPDPPVDYAPDTQREGSGFPDPQGSEISDRGGQSFLTQKLWKTREENEAPVAHAPDYDKAEAQSPYWCAACGYATPTCDHRIRYREEVYNYAPTPLPPRLPRAALQGRQAPRSGHVRRRPSTGNGRRDPAASLAP